MLKLLRFRNNYWKFKLSMSGKMEVMYESNECVEWSRPNERAS